MPGLASYVVCPRCKYKIQQNKHFTEEIKKEYRNAFAPWTIAEDQRLLVLVELKTSLPAMCVELGRQPTAIKRRIELLSYSAPVAAPAQPATPQQNWKDEEARQLKELEASHARPVARSRSARSKS